MSTVAGQLQAFYAIRTNDLARETIALRRVETDPDVAVYLEVHGEHNDLIEMVIRNVGRGPAYDVTFTVTPDQLIEFGMNFHRKLTDLPLFAQGVSYMAPGQEME